MPMEHAGTAKSTGSGPSIYERFKRQHHTSPSVSDSPFLSTSRSITSIREPPPPPHEPGLTSRPVSLTPKPADDPFAKPEVLPPPMSKSLTDSYSRIFASSSSSSRPNAAEGGVKPFPTSPNGGASGKRSSILSSAAKSSLFSNLFPSEASVTSADMDPPTSSLKALNKLGMTTTSPKAVATLTGIKVSRPAPPGSEEADDTATLSPPKSPRRRPLPSITSTSLSNSADFRKSVATSAGTGTLADVSSEDLTRSTTTSFSRPGQIGQGGFRSRTTSGATSIVTALPPPPSLPPLPPLNKVSRQAGSNDGLPTTLGCLYMVAGLPRDPSHWTPAESDGASHSTGAVQRWWRSEVLGTTVAGEEDHFRVDSLDGQHHSRIGGKGGKRSKIRNKSKLVVSKEEVAKIQAKAMKLAFTREVEVVASTLAPAATTQTFTFTVPKDSSSPVKAPGALGAAWDMAISSTARQSMSSSETTYYAASLTIWSHADAHRTQAIRTALESGSGKAKSAAIARAVKAAAAGRKFSQRLSRRVSTSAMTVDTEVDTEAYMTESEFGDGGGAGNGGGQLTYLPSNLPFWLPYALVIVSRYPLFDLMQDVLRISWARWHLNIAQHSMAMTRFINHPAPRPGEILKIPAGDGGGEVETNFVTRFPGRADLGSSGYVETNQVMWPMFRSLSADNLLTICEVALSPLGRVIFFSQHPIMLSIAVETFRYILELRGWHGICHAAVHARDVRILLEDPGPYLLAFSSQTRPIAAEPPSEVCVVDIDTDRVEIKSPCPGYISKGAARDKMRRRLEAAIGSIGSYRGVPTEMMEAFPSGRFRPFSLVEVNGTAAQAERLLPNWPNYDQDRVLSTFESILSIRPATGFRRLMFRSSVPRKIPELDPSALHVQKIVRKHASSFVDRRDMLEARIWKLNRRLAYLISESLEWKSHFELFQSFTNKLSAESQELKKKLENERREAKRLSGVVNEQQSRQVELSLQLSETEKARNAAAEELKRVETVRKELQSSRDDMMNEIAGLVEGDHADLLEGVIARLEYARSESSASRPGTSLSDHRSSSRSSRRPSSRARTYSNASEAEHGMLRPARPALSEASLGDFDMDDFEREALQRAAASATMQSLVERLQNALVKGGHAVKSTDSTTPSSSSTFSRSESEAGDETVISHRVAHSPPGGLPPSPPLSNNRVADALRDGTEHRNGNTKKVEAMPTPPSSPDQPTRRSQNGRTSPTMHMTPNGSRILAQNARTSAVMPSSPGGILPYATEPQGHGGVLLYRVSPTPSGRRRHRPTDSQSSIATATDNDDDFVSAAGSADDSPVNRLSSQSEPDGSDSETEAELDRRRRFLDNARNTRPQHSRHSTAPKSLSLVSSLPVSTSTTSLKPRPNLPSRNSSNSSLGGKTDIGSSASGGASVHTAGRPVRPQRSDRPVRRPA